MTQRRRSDHDEGMDTRSTPEAESTTEQLIVAVSPRTAAEHAKHYLSHTTFGWDGYSFDDVCDYTAERIVDFLTGTLTYERDLLPLCDEWCEPHVKG